MKTRQNTITFIVVSALSLLALIYTFTLVNIDAWLLPRILCFAILILSLAGTIKSILDDRKSAGDTDPDSVKDKQIFKPEELRPLLEMAAWLVGLIVAIYLFGFYPSILVFTFAYMKRRKRSWLTAIIYSVALTVFLYVALRIGMSSVLHGGILFSRWL